MTLYEDGDLDVVCTALRASPSHAGVQFTGCSAMSNLARAGTYLATCEAVLTVCVCVSVMCVCVCCVCVWCVFLMPCTWLVPSAVPSVAGNMNYVFDCLP